jgi:hypothetical protein
MFTVLELNCLGVLHGEFHQLLCLYFGMKPALDSGL